MKLTKIFTLSLMALALPMPDSIAGNETGNGGDVVVCRDSAGKITSIEQLDLFEAKVYTGLTADLGEPTLSFEQKLEVALKRLGRLSPNRARLYREEVDLFMKKGRFVSGISLVDIPDSEHQGFPAGCAVEQIAIQKEPLYEGYPKYLVNKDLWDALDTNNRVGLALHEAVYTEALSYGHRNSVSARALNGMILTSELNSISQEDFIERLLQLGFPAVEVDTVTDSWCHELASDTCTDCLVCGAGMWKSPDWGIVKVEKLVLQHPSGSQAEWKVRTAFPSGGSTRFEKPKFYSIIIGGSSIINFYDWGFSGKTVKEGSVFIQGKKIPLFPGSQFSISKSGVARAIRLKEDSVFRVQDQDLTFNGDITFYENQSVKTGFFRDSLVLKTRRGTCTALGDIIEVGFDEEGFAINGCY